MKRQIIDSSNVNFNENFEIIYFDKRNMAGVAMQLIATAIATFRQCNIIKELKYLNENINKRLEDLDIKKIANIAFQEPIDNVRIVMCFENYMKAVLLSKGYIVHEVDRNLETLLPISKKIKNKEPILLSEFLMYEKFYFEKNKTCKIKGISKNTISFSVLLSDKYQSIILLPSNLKIILSKINEERNHLHFQTNFNLKNNKQKINDINTIIDFVNEMHKVSDSIILENNLPMEHLQNKFYKEIMTQKPISFISKLG